MKKQKIYIDPDFCPLKDVEIRKKRGWTVGNLTFLPTKDKYRKLRNVLIRELNIKKIVFRNEKEKKKMDK